MTNDRPVAVIGAGAWGTALAHSIAQKKTRVRIWAFENEVVDSINNNSVNSPYLPDVKLPGEISATTNMADALEGCAVVIFVVPSKFMRSVLKDLAKVAGEDIIITSATKGIEMDTLALPAEVIEEIMPPKIARRHCSLSGPTFAKELVAKVPSAATIASKDETAAKMAQETLSSPYFRLYTHGDVIGVELGGAAKNVIAIAAGISDGLGFGHNTRAFLITRGLVEITRLGVAMGADERTFAGLSGMGDLVLTCTGDLSRNRTVGMRLGKGETIEEITRSMTAVAEGVTTALSIHRLAEKHGVNMPITREVYNLLYEGKELEKAVEDLMRLSLDSEF